MHAGFVTFQQNELPHEKKQRNDVWAERRLRSDWADAQADLSLRCPHEETLGPVLPNERTTDAQADLSLRWAHSHFVGFVTKRIK